MVKSEKKTRNPVWLRLSGYHVAASKPGFDEHALELERAVQTGILAYPDLDRGDFYDVPLEQGWAYIHVYRNGHAVYLIAYMSTFNPLAAGPSWATPSRKFERKTDGC
jgi:hypothetical protein